MLVAHTTELEIMVAEEEVLGLLALLPLQLFLVMAAQELCLVLVAHKFNMPVVVVAVVITAIPGVLVLAAAVTEVCLSPLPLVAVLAV
jgi:hypothetical protein